MDAPKVHTDPQRNINKALLLELDKRLQHLGRNKVKSKFANPVTLGSRWVGSSVVKDVLNLESNTKPVTKEARMLNRMDLWVEACRVRKLRLESWERLYDDYPRNRYPGNAPGTCPLKTKKPHVLKKVRRFTKSSDDLCPEVGTSRQWKIVHCNVFADGAAPPPRTSFSTNDLRPSKPRNESLTLPPPRAQSSLDVKHGNRRSRIFGSVFPSRGGSEKKSKQNADPKMGKKKSSTPYYEVLHFDQI